MANPIETIPHLGPYAITDVTDAMLQNLVCVQQKPLIIKQAHPASGGTLYAVLATKDVRMVCAGCFRRDMLITDATRCKKCASFVKHFDTKNGVRRRSCKDDGDINTMDADCTEVVIKDGATEPAVLDDVKLLWMVKERGLTERLLDDVSDEDLLEAIKKRELVEVGIRNMDDEAFASAIKMRGFKSVIDAHPAELVHELARQHGTVTTESYYGVAKVEDQNGNVLPHWTDKVEATLTVACVPSTIRHGTRGVTRQMQNSVTRLHFKPMALNDLDWAVDIEDLATKLTLDAVSEAKDTVSETGTKKRKAYGPKKHVPKSEKRSKMVKHGGTK